MTPSVFEFTGPAVILLVISNDEISPLPLEYSQHFFPETPKPGQPSSPPETVELVAMEPFISPSKPLSHSVYRVIIDQLQSKF